MIDIKTYTPPLKRNNAQRSMTSTFTAKVKPSSDSVSFTAQRDKNVCPKRNGALALLALGASILLQQQLTKIDPSLIVPQEPVLPGIEEVISPKRPIEEYMPAAQRVISQISQDPSAPSIPVEKVPQMLSYLGLSSKYEELKPHEKYFIDQAFDPQKDKTVDARDIAKVLQSADLSSFGETVMKSRDFNDGVVGVFEMENLQAQYTIKYLESQIAETEGLSEDIKQEASRRLNHGDFSGSHYNLMDAPQLTGDGAFFRAKESIERFYQNTEKLGMKDGKAFYFTALAKGDVGHISLPEKNDPQQDVFYFETHNAGTLREFMGRRYIPLTSTTMTFSRDDFSSPIQKETVEYGKSNFIESYSIPSPPKDGYLAEFPKLLEAEKTINETVLTSDRMKKLVETIDYTNKESIQEQTEPLMREIAEILELENYKLVFNEKLRDFLGGAFEYDDEGNPVLKIDSDGISNLYKSYRQNGATEEAARVKTTEYLVEISTHELWHMKQQQFIYAEGMPEDATEQDKRAITELRYTDYVSSAQSREITGESTLYTSYPEEKQAFRFGIGTQERVRSIFAEMN